MSEDISNPLDVDLSQVDTKFPVLKPDLYEMRVKDIDLMTNAARTMKITLETTGPATDTQGNPVDAGALVYTNLNTALTGATKPKQLQTSVGSFVQAFGAVTQGWNGQRLLSSYKELVGQVVTCNVIVQPAGPDKHGTYWDARNAVKSYMKAS